jgi:Tfp pilus assembly protein PilO
MAFNWQTELYRYRRYFTDIRRFYHLKKVRVYTEIVLSILTVAFFLFFAIRPTVITITGLIKEISDKKMVVQKLEEKINNLNLAQQEYLLVQNDLYLVDQALPEDSQISVLVRQIEGLCFKTGVSLEGVQYSSLEIKSRIFKNEPQPVEIKLVVSGDYQNLKNFLYSLNNFRRVFKIDGFGFKTSKEEEKLTLSISGKTFYLQKTNE